MRFDFFRRASEGAGAETGASTQPEAGCEGHLAYAMLLDAQRRVIGYRMPREAIALGAVDDVSPLAEVSRRVLAHLRTFGERTNRV